MDSEYESDSGSSDCCSEDFEICSRSIPFASGGGGGLPFDATSLEQIVLKISDVFDFRVVMSDARMSNALLVTTGMTIAGGLLGKHYGGNIGAAIGSAVGGACGLGIVVVSMREIWGEVKAKLMELLDIVYDYISGLGIKDYNAALSYVTSKPPDSSQLASIMLQVITSSLGKKVLSSLTGI